MRFSICSRLFGVLAIIALLVPGILWAQSATQGAIDGTVTDASGAILPNATVTIKSLDLGFTSTVTTNSSGGYSFPLVSPGTFTVTVAASGFKQFSAKTTVLVGQATTVNARLEVGTVGTTVEVSGEAPILNVETADNSNAFDQNLVANIPNGGNDLTAVAYTSPGVVMNSGGGYGNFNVNGLPATSNMFVVDGENQMDPFLNLNNSGPTNLMLGKNSIEEATVVTTAVSGQYGQQAGAQVNYVSKGGTNQYHGNVGYQWTGRYLDANDWFNGGIFGATSPAPPANNNIWMASFGGPIKKDKLFFFLDTEGIRYIVPSTVTVQAPTPAFMAATIANLGATGATQNTIATYQKAAALWAAAPGYGTGQALGAQSCVDPLTGASVSSLGSGCFENYTASPALPASETLGIGRIDWNISSKDRMFFRFDIDTGVQATYADPINPAFSAASYQPEYNNNLNWTHAFSGTTTNTFIAAVSYYRAIFETNTNGPTSPFPYSLYVGNSEAVTTSPVGLGSATGLNALNFNFPQGRNVTQYQFVDDFAKVIGKHALKVGGNFRRYDISNHDASTLATPLVYAGLQDFYNGSASLFIQNNALHGSAPMNTGGLGLYAQDEWSVTSRLKLTFALRGEHNFNPTCNIACFTMPKANFGTIAGQGVDTPYNAALNINRTSAFNSVQAVNLSPRVGFTWSPLSSGKTVIGGAFSILYDAFPAFITDNFVNVPYLIGVTQVSPAAGGAAAVPWADPNGAAAVTAATANTIRNGDPALGIPSLANGLTMAQLEAAGGAVPNMTGFPNQLKTPQIQQWNLSVQQQLDSKSRLMLQYTGNHGIYEAYPNNTLNATAAVFGYNATTPDPRFGTYTDWQSGAISNYNGLTASYSRRMTVGLVVNASYTWSHSLDEISNGGLLPYGVTAIQGQINPLSLRANNYGNADYDIRHSYNANYVWNLPFRTENRGLNLLFGGWMLSQNFNGRSGLPYTVTDGTAATSSGFPVPAEVIGNGQQTCRNGYSSCFNSAAFVSATANPSAFPNQVRNQYRGPDFFNSDVTLGKSFHATERVRMTIGMNVYNVFNRPNFQNPNRVWSGASCSTVAAGFNQPSCGQITGQAAPPTGPYGSFFQGLPAGRSGQLQAKIEF